MVTLKKKYKKILIFIVCMNCFDEVYTGKNSNLASYICTSAKYNNNPKYHNQRKMSQLAPQNVTVDAKYLYFNAKCPDANVSLRFRVFAK